MLRRLLRDRGCRPPLRGILENLLDYLTRDPGDGGPSVRRAGGPSSVPRRLTSFQLLQSKFSRSAPRAPPARRREVGPLAAAGGGGTPNMGGEPEKNRRGGGDLKPGRSGGVKDIVRRFTAAERRGRGRGLEKEPPIKTRLLGRGPLLSALMETFEKIATVQKGRCSSGRPPGKGGGAAAGGGGACPDPTEKKADPRGVEEHLRPREDPEKLDVGAGSEAARSRLRFGQQGALCSSGITEWAPPPELHAVAILTSTWSIAVDSSPRQHLKTFEPQDVEALGEVVRDLQATGQGEEPASPGVPPDPPSRPRYPIPCVHRRNRPSAAGRGGGGDPDPLTSDPLTSDPLDLQPPSVRTAAGKYRRGGEEAEDSEEAQRLAAAAAEVFPQTQQRSKYTTINYGVATATQTYKPKVIRFTDTFTF